MYTSSSTLFGILFSAAIVVLMTAVAAGTPVLHVVLHVLYSLPPIFG